MELNSIYHWGSLMVTPVSFINQNVDSTRLFIYFVFLIQIGPSINPLSGQQLLNNSGFEDYTIELDNLPNLMPKSTIQYLENWNFTGYEYISYCHSKFIEKYGRDNYKKSGYSYYSLTPHTGNGMIELSYSESSKQNGEYGAASYITTKLTNPLAIGEVYKITYWIYFPDREPVDKGIYNNIGLFLSRKPLKANRLINTTYFINGPFEINRWTKVVCYVRALCALEYFTFGAFEDNKFPKIHKFSGQVDEYYIDDISIEKINQDTISSDVSPTPYCEYYEKLEKIKPKGESVQIDVYFASNDAALDDGDKAKLDSFYYYSNLEEGEVYVISGYTDNLGRENKLLSEDRAKVVENYLIDKYSVNRKNIISIGFSDRNPIGNNSTAYGREINRRVSIKTIYIGKYSSLYRIGLDYINNNNLVEATHIFVNWVKLVPTEQKIQLLLDSRLNILRNSSYWDGIKEEVLRYYSFYPKPEISFYLDSLYFSDQLYRLFSPLELTGFISGIDNECLDPFVENNTLQSRKDSINLEIIKIYISNNGFPKITDVGRRQVRGVCNIIIHGGDTSFQRRIMPILKENCGLGEAEWSAYANMVDKYCYECGMPQLYGTQKCRVDNMNNPFQIYRIDDLIKVNERRKRIGLNAIDESEIILNIKDN